MAICACAGANMLCTFGTAPATLIVNSQTTVLTSTPMATIMDNKPIANIPPFGMCNSLANPSTASATAAALGVLTPMPCVPNTSTPWAPGCATVLLANYPALNNTSQLVCAWGGAISMTSAGQTKIMVP